MLKLADTSIEDAIQFFAEYGLQAGFVVPTETGLHKGILDAHEQMRTWLKAQDLHDFADQLQGDLGKHVLDDVVVVGEHALAKTRLSLYRPKTKQGDPRMWIYGLSKFAEPGNLFAMIKTGPESVAVINMSDPMVLRTAAIEGSPLDDVLQQAVRVVDDPIQDLLGKLRGVAAQGWVRSLRQGDTGVGYTLETLLGIEANARKTPDYRGIEIKSKRTRVTAGRRSMRTKSTLFAQVPDWNTSAVSARELVERYGYPEAASGRQQLYCTVNHIPNPQRLVLTVDEAMERLRCDEAAGVPRLLVWSMDTLMQRLQQKHASTFWVQADVRHDVDGIEEFRFHRVALTAQPLVANLAPLLSRGVVTLDLAMHLKENGRTVRDHGYLFRMWGADLEKLIPQTRLVELTT